MHRCLKVRSRHKEGRETRYGSIRCYEAKLWWRQTPQSSTAATETIVQRQDRALTGGERHLVVQGDMQWLTAAGSVIFETSNAYGVERSTRQNIAAYGNAERNGQYLFPPHTAQTSYAFADPIYAGAYTATFNRTEDFRGVRVYVFDSVADGIDETAGYAALPDVPERYIALTYGNGQLWVEPVSGIVVNHEDQGTSYFVDPKTRRHIGAPMNIWNARYSAQTIAAQLQRAVTTRRQMLSLEIALPLALALGAAIALGAALRCRRGGKP